MDEGAQRIHVLLGAGGVRCLSYIGALEQLEREGYEIATVSTCSAGTFVGALYCCGVTPSELREDALELDVRELAGSRRLPGILRLLSLASWPHAMYREPGSPRVFREVLAGRGLDPDPTLGSLQRPLSTAAVDVAARRLLVYSSEANPEMRVAEVISIATAVPIYYPPHLRQGREILDASLASQAPIWLATGQSEDLPIVVLRTLEKSRPVRGSFPKWANQVLTGSVASRDTFLLERLPRVSVCDIDSQVSALDFSISRAQVEELIESGRRAIAEQEERRQEQDPCIAPRRRPRPGERRRAVRDTFGARVEESRRDDLHLLRARRQTVGDPPPKQARRPAGR